MTPPPDYWPPLWQAQTHAAQDLDGLYAWLRWCMTHMEPSLAARAAEAIAEEATPRDFEEVEERKAKS